LPEGNKEVIAVGQDYLSVDEAAAELGVSRATLYKWIKRNDIGTFRIVGDRRTLMRRTDVEKLKEPIPMGEAKKSAA
jgi:excisionase family DNA binding protein